MPGSSKKINGSQHVAVASCLLSKEPRDFPLPVAATPTRSCPVKAAGMAARWTGEGLEIPEPKRHLRHAVALPQCLAHTAERLGAEGFAALWKAASAARKSRRSFPLCQFECTLCTLLLLSNIVILRSVRTAILSTAEPAILAKSILLTDSSWSRHPSCKTEKP